LQPLLLWIYQTKTQQYESDSEAINALKSLYQQDVSTAAKLIREIRAHKGTWAFNKWFIRQMPFPSTCHFEVACFGRRLDKRSNWAKLGNKAHSTAFQYIRQCRDRPTLREAREHVEEIGRRGGPDAQQAFRFIYGYDQDCQFIGDESVFTYEVKIAQGKKEEAGGHASTHRSRNAAARHNVKRFATWIWRAVTSDERKSIAVQWTKLARFRKSAIIEHYVVHYGELPSWIPRDSDPDDSNPNRTDDSTNSNSDSINPN
jgi:hypothetical protein